MTQDESADQQRTLRRRVLTSISATAGLVGLVLCAVAIFVLANGVWREVDALAAANSDTTLWSLAQTEVDLLSLQVAIHSTEHDDASAPDLVEIRKRFDIVYSRIHLLLEGQQFAELRAAPNVSENLARIAGVLESYVPVIDGPDSGLAAALPRIEDDLGELRPVARDFSLLGAKLFASDSDTQRESLASLLTRIGYLMLAFVLTLLAGIGILTAMFRRSTRAEREAGEAHGRLQELVSTSFDAIIGADFDGKLIEYNGAAERIFGYSREEAIGGDMAELIIPEHMRNAHAAGMKRYRETRERRVIGKGLVRLEARRKDGTVFPVEMSLSATNYGGKEIFVSYLRDISDRVAAEKELIAARDSAVEGERAKAEVLAVMSHEMRTPLNGILGTIELLEDSRLTAAQGRYIAAMKTSAGLLLHHVNGVLSMSRADAGQLDLIAAEVDPASLLVELVESQRHAIEASGNKIFCDTTAAPPRIWVDAHRLRQVILNLVGNANKFTRQGEIRVECDVILGTGEVEFRVIDNGIGIAEKDVDRIFEEFRTLDTSYSRRAEGTGLGLAISRRLAKAMGGDIGVDSEPGEGSLFWLRLPVGAPPVADQDAPEAEPRETAPAANSTAPQGLQILLVEDNAINRLVAHEMLLKDGHIVLEAHDGLEGVRLANQRRFDLILMDISMPDLDGVAATSIIRNAEGPNKRTPVIALTAHALPEDTKRFLAAGINDILIKPLSIDALRKVLASNSRLSALAIDPADPRITSVHAELSDQLGAERASRLLEDFRTEAEQLVARATGPDWDSEPPEARADAVHKLAGSAAVLGAARLRICLQAMEADYRQGREEAARRRITDLQAIWDQAGAEISACLGDGAKALRNRKTMG